MSNNSKYIGTLVGSMVRTGIIECGSLDWELIIGPTEYGYPIDGNTQNKSEISSAIQESFETEVAKGYATLTTITPNITRNNLENPVELASLLSERAKQKSHHRPKSR